MLEAFCEWCFMEFKDMFFSPFLIIITDAHSSSLVLSSPALYPACTVVQTKVKYYKGLVRFKSDL